MEEIINLNSRGDNHNYLKRIKRVDGKESKTYVLKTEYNLRVGYIENHKKFIDPSGGPMIVEDGTLAEANAVIKSIDFIEGYGYTITFY